MNIAILFNEVNANPMGIVAGDSRNLTRRKAINALMNSVPART